MMSLSTRRLSITRLAALAFVATGCAQAVPAGTGGQPDAHIITSVPDAHIIVTNEPDAHIIAGQPDAHPFADAAPTIDAAPVTGQTTLNENTDNSIDPTSGFGCSDQNVGTTFANTFYRVFPLSSAGISTSFTVSEVDFAVLFATAGDLSGSQDVTVTIYSMSATAGDPLDTTALTQLASVTAAVADATAGESVAAPIVGTVPAGQSLVVSIDVPDGTTTGNVFGLGFNADGETQSGYIVAPNCGATTAILINPDASGVASGGGTGEDDILVQAVGATN